jgi:hypothetical protein
LTVWEMRISTVYSRHPFDSFLYQRASTVMTVFNQQNYAA